jgi:transposase-like protein
MKWHKLIHEQKQERIALVQESFDAGMSLSEAARNLGITRQQLHVFCKSNGIKSRPRNSTEIIEKK